MDQNGVALAITVSCSPSIVVVIAQSISLKPQESFNPIDVSIVEALSILSTTKLWWISMTWAAVGFETSRLGPDRLGKSVGGQIGDWIRV